MKEYITLDEIGLNEKTGVLGKIRRLIIEEVSCKKIYKEIETEIKYKDGNRKLSAHWAGYPSTKKIKVVDKYLYPADNLLAWFHANETIIFNQKEVYISKWYDYQQIETLLKKKQL